MKSGSRLLTGRHRDALAFHLSDALYRLRARDFVAKFLERAVDWNHWRQLEDKYRREFGARRGTKFFDAHKYLSGAGAFAYRLGLQKPLRKRVLDVGCGFGYFLLACQLLGHRAVGVDLDDEILEEVTTALGVRRIAHRIQAYQPLPTIPGEPFDVITAFAITFNNHNMANLWDVAEWRFFLDDLAKHARPGATTLLLFNRERARGLHLSDTLCRFFRGRNARVRQSVGFVELTLSPT